MIIVPASDPLVSSGTWTVCTDDDAWDKALSLARGSYQRAIVRGQEACSGSTLRGRAKEYRGRYRASLDNFVKRLEKAGVEVGEVYVGAQRKRVLVLGPMPEHWRAADTLHRVDPREVVKV